MLDFPPAFTKSDDAPIKLTRKDLQTDNDVRWCPGCGDYAILATMQRFLPELNIPQERLVMISGIGCAARFPYYMETYGMHTVHGRAPSIATGLKLARPDLAVWVISGDGDSLSIGGNHTLHMIRRNVNLKVLLFNNRIYGLTKGQYSPSSEVGKVTKSTPLGSVDAPVNPAAFAIGCGSNFFARNVDVNPKHMMEVFRAAHEHQGAAYMEIMQNCVVFNDGAWAGFTDKKSKGTTTLALEHGKPMLFDGGKKGIGFDAAARKPFVIDLEQEPGRESEVLVHDEKEPTGQHAWMLAHMDQPEFPLPIGVFVRREAPVYDAEVSKQTEKAMEARKDDATLENLLFAGDMWTVD